MQINKYLSKGNIIDSGDNANGSWTKFDNGLLMQTQNISITITGIIYSAPIRYSDVPIGAWQVPFTKIDYLDCQVHQPQFWTATSLNSAIRVFRAEAYTSTSINLVVFAIGKWK